VRDGKRGRGRVVRCAGRCRCGAIRRCHGHRGVGSVAWRVGTGGVLSPSRDQLLFRLRLGHATALRSAGRARASSRAPRARCGPESELGREEHLCRTCVAMNGRWHDVQRPRRGHWAGTTHRSRCSRQCCCCPCPSGRLALSALWGCGGLDGRPKGRQLWLLDASFKHRSFAHHHSGSILWCHKHDQRETGT
jgi:hypothetical protein